MLEFALRYHTAIDDIAGNKAAGLRRYELDGNEWKIARQLCDILKVFFHTRAMVDRESS